MMYRALLIVVTVVAGLAASCGPVQVASITLQVREPFATNRRAAENTNLITALDEQKPKSVSFKPPDPTCARSWSSQAASVALR